jgi:hypothetical protein
MLTGRMSESSSTHSSSKVKSNDNLIISLVHGKVLKILFHRCLGVRHHLAMKGDVLKL